MTSSKTSGRIEAVVADANVLLSAVIGKAALRVFTDFEVEVHASRYNCDEVEEYLPRLTSKYSLSEELVRIQWQILPLRTHPEHEYAGRFDEAMSRLAERDADDAHPLALALTLGLPLWSNDSDLVDRGVKVFTTASMLAELERG